MRHNYLINGNMIGGFGLIAWPVEYGHSGIMTFIVNHPGRVYQKDLGSKTSRIATRIRSHEAAVLVTKARSLIGERLRGEHSVGVPGGINRSTFVTRVVGNLQITG